MSYRAEGCDVWSAGCVLYALVCGHLPFQNGAQRHGRICIAWPAHMSCALRDLLSHMLLFNPRERVGLHSVASAAWLRPLLHPHPHLSPTVSRQSQSPSTARAHMHTHAHMQTAGHAHANARAPAAHPHPLAPCRAAVAASACCAPALSG